MGLVSCRLHRCIVTTGYGEIWVWLEVPHSDLQQIDTSRAAPQQEREKRERKRERARAWLLFFCYSFNCCRRRL